MYAEMKRAHCFDPRDPLDALGWCRGNVVPRHLRLAFFTVLHSDHFLTGVDMPDPNVLDDLSARISQALAATPVADIEKNLRAMLTAGLAKLDLVTREDFEIQKELLMRAQQRLAALEARLAEIEGRRKP